MRLLTQLKMAVSPFFIGKRYLVNEVKRLASRPEMTGSLLDFGCGSQPYRTYFCHTTSYEGIDFAHYSVNTTFIAKKPEHSFDRQYERTGRTSLPSHHFDTVVSFQVLEHHPDAAGMIDELFRLCRPGGHILITWPFLGGLHEMPHDYQRLTESSFLRLIKARRGRVVYLSRQGSVCSTIFLLAGEYVDDLALRGGLHRLLAAVLWPGVVIGQYLCVPLDWLLKSDRIFFNYCAIVKTPQ